MQDQPAHRCDDQERVEAVHDAAVAGQQIAHVLDPDVALDQRLAEVAERRRQRDGTTEHQADPGLAVQQIDDGQPAGQDTGQHRAGEPLPGLGRTDRRRHLVAAELVARDVAADVGAHRDEEEGQDPPVAVVLGQHEHREPGEQRDPRRDEHTRGDVAYKSVRSLGEPPHHGADDREREGDGQYLRPAEVGAGEHRGTADGHRDERQPDASDGQRVRELPQGQQDREYDDTEEDRLDNEERADDDDAEHDADADRGRHVAASTATALRRGRAFAVRIGSDAARPGRAMRCHRWSRLSPGPSQTSMSSASLCLSRSSTASTCFLVRPSSRFSALMTSSLPASPSFSILSSVCLAWRRMLRIATRPSSAFVLASLMYSLRRSSVSSGITRRSTVPSLAGLTPRSESRIAFSIAVIEFLSYAEITTTRGSGMWNEASCWIGVGEP